MNKRLEQLFDFLANEPNDPFLLYAIAMEYRKDNTEQANLYYNRLLSEHAQYLPTYYHAAHFFAELEDFERAKQIYEQGVDLAKKQGDSMALRELQNAYNLLLFELEDE